MKFGDEAIGVGHFADGMSGTFKDDETEQFFQLIHMFQRSSLLHMGMIPDNEGNFIFNLGEAKAGIHFCMSVEVPALSLPRAVPSMGKHTIGPPKGIEVRD